MLLSARIRIESAVPGPALSVPASATAHRDGVVPTDPLARAPAEGPRLGRSWVVVLTVCISLGLAEAAQAYWLPSPGPNSGFTGLRALGMGLGIWGGWAFVWLIAWPLAQRFPLGPQHWRGRLVLHAAAGAGCALLKILLDYFPIKFCYCPTPDRLTFSAFFHSAFTGYFLRYILLCWAMIGVSHALGYYRKYRDGQLRAAQLAADLSRARLQLLKTQLQPHFLFNTLNAISALVHVDAEAADRMLARLGELLRLALEDFGLQEAPLARELEAARSYLEIEQARLGPRLKVQWDIAPDVGDALVPTFLLQPLIENAVHHGIAPRIEAGCIDIHIRRNGPELHLEVRDDGPGLAAGATASGGVGLANTQARLLHLYGADQRLEVGNGPNGGCVARVILPFHEQPAELAGNTRERDDPHSDR